MVHFKNLALNDGTIDYYLQQKKFYSFGPWRVSLSTSRYPPASTSALHDFKMSGALIGGTTWSISYGKTV